MAETTTKPKPVVTISANGEHRAAVARFARVVDGTAKLSDELLTSLETGERAAIDAVGRFVIAVEEACRKKSRTPQRSRRRSRSLAYRWPTD